MKRRMTCARVRRHFDALLDGRADESVQVDVENHLAACHPCAEDYTFRCKVARGLRSWPRPSAHGIAPPAVTALDTAPAPSAQLTDEAMSSQALRSRWQSWQQVAAAALVVLGLGVTHVLAFWLGDARAMPGASGDSIAGAPGVMPVTATAFAELGREQLPRIADLHLENAGQLTRMARLDHDGTTAAVMNRPVGRDLVSTAKKLTALSAAHPALRSLQADFRTYSSKLQSLVGADRQSVARIADSIDHLVGRLRRQLSDLAVADLVEGSVDAPVAGDPDQRIAIAVRRLFNRDYRGATRVAKAMIENGERVRLLAVPVIEGARAGEVAAFDVVTQLLEAEPSLMRPVSEAMQRFAPWRGYSELEERLKAFMRQQPFMRIHVGRR